MKKIGLITIHDTLNYGSLLQTYALYKAIESLGVEIELIDYDVLFIGLPCQVAAIKNLVRITTVKGNLITVDLVCHGTPPPIYLQQHIKAIELKQKQKFTKCFFRDAKFDTSNFAYASYILCLYVNFKE